MVGLTYSKCHYRCAGRDPTAGHALGPCRLAVVVVGSDYSSFLSFFPVHHGRVGCGRLDPHEDANQAQAPKIGPPLRTGRHLGCLEAVGSGVGRVSAFPNHCQFATDDSLGNESPLFAIPKTENSAEDHHHGCPTSPDPATRCGVQPSNPGRNPSTSVPYHRPESRFHEKFESSVGHHPLNQQHHSYLCHSDSDRRTCAGENGLVSQHELKGRLCSWCKWVSA